MSESPELQRSDLRASDADRERVAAALRDHAAQGRLEPEELEERLTRAYGARMRGELVEITRDLPAARPRRQDRRRADVRAHFTVFLLVNLMLIAIWAACGFGYFWPMWPLMGWGIGMVKHARWRAFSRP
jgi:hypothetical protein